MSNYSGMIIDPGDKNANKLYNFPGVEMGVTFQFATGHM